MKNEQEMLDYIERFITQQGNEGAMKVSPLLIAMVEMLFAKPFTIMLHSEVRNNINNDNLWADVKELIKLKSNIAIV